MVRAALSVVALVLATACATPTGRPAYAPLPPDDPRPAALLSGWVDAVRHRTSLRARAHLALDGRDGGVRVRSKQVLVVERPARLRVEVLGFMDQTAGLIATDGERFEVFRAADGSYDTGPVDPLLLWREARLALTPVEIVDLLLGASTALGGLTPRRPAISEEGDVRMELVDAAGEVRRRVIFGSGGLLRELEVFGARGEALWRAGFDAYDDVDGAAVAHFIALEVASGGAKVEISLRDVELNPALPADIFRLRAAVATGGGRGEGG